MADFTPNNALEEKILTKLKVLLNSDDGEEDAETSWLESGSSGNRIYIGMDAVNKADGGFRFKQAVIPNNAEIVKAVLRLEGHGAFSNPTYLKIKGIKEASPNTFAGDGSDRPSTRAKTTVAVDWDFEGGGGEGNWVKSPDIKAVIQEIIDQPEFDNKAIALVIEPDGDCPENKLINIYDSSAGTEHAAQLILTIKPRIS